MSIDLREDVSLVLKMAFKIFSSVTGAKTSFREYRDLQEVFSRLASINTLFTEAGILLEALKTIISSFSRSCKADHCVLRSHIYFSNILFQNYQFKKRCISTGLSKHKEDF